MQSILTVCVGNICRSPVAAALLRADLPDVHVSSAGIAALVGEDVDPTARQVAEKGVTINNLLPGSHDTDRAIALEKGVAKAQDVSMEEARKIRCKAIPSGRYGTIEEFGATCAFLCSQHAGFIVGQNILLDGGQTNATI